MVPAPLRKLFKFLLFSFTTSGLYVHLYVCVYSATIFCPILITLSHTDSLNGLIGCSGLFFFHQVIYLFWIKFALVYSNMISPFSFLFLNLQLNNVGDIQYVALFRAV